MRSRTSTRLLVFGVLVAAVGLLGSNCYKGLKFDAYLELNASGVNKYLGAFDPIASTDVGDGWVRHDFDPDNGNGPICIAGTPYSVYSRDGNPSKLLIFEQGGGACWQDFIQNPPGNPTCNIRAEDQAPPFPRVGIWDFDDPDNPFADHSIVYLPYCDGSVFAGDNVVVDPDWQALIEGLLGLPPGFGPPARIHRGLRNQSAGMDVARDLYPLAHRITTAGSSAGGVGVAGFAPFLVRFLWGNIPKLTNFNDAGPVSVNLNDVAGIAARAADWQFGQFYPASCTDCSDMGQATEIIKWRLDNDLSIREAFYETDQDLTNRFFLGLLFDPAGFRNLVVTEHGLINSAHPDRYKRFIVANDSSHTALQGPLFYSQDADGVLLNEWTEDFLKNQPGWIDIVEE